MQSLHPMLARAGTLALGLLLGAAPAQAGRADVGGYLRVGARPDFQGGDNKLGYWNLYGRLLNEGPYYALEFRYDALPRQAGRADPWTSLHAKVEGGSVHGADPANGSLTAFRLSQLYTKAGNVGVPNVTWQVGTLDSYFGDLGLYDMKPAQVFYETVGMSALWETKPVDLLVGFGDSGYFVRGLEYSTILTPGGTLRARVGKHLEVGAGGQYMFEPAVAGNRFAPHSTPGVEMEDLLRGEVVERYLQSNPNRELEFPDPVPTSAQSWKLVGYLGFGNLGPLVWNNFFVRYGTLHPESSITETYQGEDTTIYLSELTDERSLLLMGDEIQLRVIPKRLDIAIAGLYGDQSDGDNSLAPSDYARRYMSAVVRAQVYMTPTVHWLAETSIAKEKSKNGNAYREHADSIFSGTGGVPNTQGFEVGDTDTRHTWQGKTGVVLNPLGPGIYTRPSIRLLYGLQYSNQNNAFGNSFVEDIDQYNEYGNVEQHWHHLVALETEAWF